MVRAVPRLSGFRSGARGPESVAGRKETIPGLARGGSDPRSHRRRRTSSHDERNPPRDGEGSAAGPGVRHRLSQEPASRRPEGNGGGESAHYLGASDVRPGYRLALGPPCHFRRRGGARGDGGSAGALRFHHGGSRLDGPREPRPAHCLRARSFPRSQYRVLHRPRRERRSRAPAIDSLQHHLRRAARGLEEGRGREPEALFRDPVSQRLRHGIADRASLRGREASIRGEGAGRVRVRRAHGARARLLELRR